MEVGTQAMDHLINILQTDRYVDVVFLFGLVSVMLSWKELCTSYKVTSKCFVLFDFLLPANPTGLTLKSSAMLWTHCTTSSAMMRRRSKVFNPPTIIWNSEIRFKISYQLKRIPFNCVATVVLTDWATDLFACVNEFNSCQLDISQFSFPSSVHW